MSDMKFRRIGLVLMILAVVYDGVESFLNVYPRVKRSRMRQDAGEKLFLTPMIENGQIEAARQRAKVEHPEMLNVPSYAGYLTVNKNYNSNMFFWFFPAQVNPQNAPVVLYLEGGPGAPGFFGLFMLNGPFVVSPEMKVSLRNTSWAITQNLIYIDNPVGTGYSFTENDAGYANDQAQIGRDLYSAMSQFFQLFPSLRNNDFYITGESYAGKFVPAFGRAIHDLNAKSRTKINLKGMMVGNGFTDPGNQLRYGDLLYQIGLIDLNGLRQFHVLEKRARDLIKAEKYNDAYDAIAKLIDGSPTGPPTLFKNLTGYDYIFNYLENDAWIHVEYAYGWVQRSDVRAALHVGDTSFNGGALNVVSHLKNEGARSQAGNVAFLLDYYKYMTFTGNLDLVVGYPMVEHYLEKLTWSGSEQFKKAPRKLWKVNGKLAGYSKVVCNLTEIMVRNAGHLTIADQPEWTLDLLKRFTNGTGF